MIPKKYKYKAQQRGSSFWHYSTSKSRAKKIAGERGIVKRR